MKKDKEWLSEQVRELNSTDAVFNESGVSYIDTAVSIERVYDLIDQLDEPEVLSQELPVIPEHIVESITRAFDVETTSKTIEALTGMTIEQVAEEIRDGKFVPKQEEVDRAYKYGYEEGKQHATEKQSEKTETVARVLVDYLIASAKLKLALSKEVEELTK